MAYSRGEAGKEKRRREERRSKKTGGEKREDKGEKKERRFIIAIHFYCLFKQSVNTDSNLDKHDVSDTMFWT